MFAPVAYSGLAYGQAIEVRSVADAEALGITEAYDTTNGTLNYRHVSEVFRLAPRTVTPSGKLTDTYPITFADAWSSENFPQSTIEKKPDISMFFLTER